MPPPAEQTATAAIATPNQRHLWWFDRFYTHDGTFNVTFGVRLSGPVQVDLLQAALTALVARHEALRTTFDERQGELLQVIAPAETVELPLTTVVPLDGQTATEALEARFAADSATACDSRLGPLFRVCLYRADEHEHLLGVVVHHIVFDGWSVGVFLRELASTYSAACRGDASALPDLPIQFADFAEWQERERDPAGHDTSLAYWRRQLAGAHRQIDLPTDRPRRERASRRGHMIRRYVAPALDAGLREAAQRQRTTLYTVLLASFATVIGRLAGLHDVLIGTPVAGRPRVELETLIGFFAKTVLIRVQRDPTVCFRALVERVGQDVLEALEHQQTPLDDINGILAGRGAEGATPIMQVVFALEHAPAIDRLFGQARAELLWVHNGTAKYDVFLNAVDEGGRLRFDLECDADLFDLRTGERLLDSYEVLLTGVVASPEAPIDQLPIVSATDKAIIHRANQTSRVYPNDASVPDVLASVARQTPEAVAVRCEGEEVSFDALDRRASRLAQALVGRGVGPDVCVGVALDRSVDLVVALLGILKAGGAYVPLDRTYPPDRLAYMVADTDLRLILTDGGDDGVLPDGPERLSVAAAVAAAGADAVAPSRATATTLAYVMYTSGSTGRPKGVAVTHRNIVRLCAAQTYVDWSRVHSVLHMAPIAFDASTFELWGPLLNGKTVVIYPERQLDPDCLDAVLKRDKVDCVWLTAALFNTIVDSRPDALLGVRQLLAGGETLSVPHVQRAQRALPNTQIINGYGPTECTTFACCFRVPNPWPTDAGSIPIGGPIANTVAHVLDTNGLEVPVGVAGELYLGGDGLSRGYVNQPALTAERFVEVRIDSSPVRLYRTGDRVRWLPDGTLEFLGRLDRQVKIRGFRIELSEIEHALGHMASIGQAVVIVREDAPGDRRVVAYVSARGHATVSPAEVKSALETTLPPYMVPAAIVVLEALPETANGKIDRDALPKPLGVDVPPAETGALETALERDLAAIWCEVLGVDAVGRHDNFFDLGGHSLRAIQVCVKVRDTLGVEFPFSRILQCPTIATLATAIGDDRKPREERATEKAIVPLRVGGNRPPIFFTHGVGAEVWSFASLTQHLGDDQPVYGLLPLPEHQERAVGIVAMAQRYVEEIQQIVPRGPYLLAGHCSGAAVAFEIGQQLAKAGKPADLLAVLDYAFFDTLDRRWLPRGVQFIRNFPVWLSDDLVRVGWRTAVGRLGSHLRFWWAETTRRIGRPHAAGADIRDQLGMWRFPDHQATALERAYRMFQAYRPQTYVGNILLITPRAQPLLAPRPAADLGWGRVVRGTVSVRTIKGSHETMLHEPFVAELAQILRRETDRALGASERNSDKPAQTSAS